MRAACSLWLIAFAAWGAGGAAPTNDPSTALFDPQRLLDVRIEIATNDWDKLRLEHHDLLAALGPTRFEKPEPKPYHTYKATVTIGGLTVKSVGLRKRAFLGSGSATRPSLGLRFDEFDSDQRFAGLKRISLNNNLQDPTLVHQALAYRIFAQAGVPAPRCNFARVTVNGKFLGVYSHVEAVEAEFLRRRFGDASGHLYEGLVTDFRPDWVKTFQRKNHQSDADRSDLDAVVKALQAGDAELLARLEPLVDLDEYLTFWAVESLIGHWDSYSNNGNNFFVYRVPATQKFQFIPWGADSVLGDPDPFTQAKVPASVTARSILPWRLYKLPTMREQYRERLRQVLKSAWNEAELLAEVDRMEAMLRGQIGREQSLNGLASVRQFIRTRRAVLEKDLAGPAPEWPLALKKSGCLSKTGTLRATFDTVWLGRGPSNEVVQSTAFVSMDLDATKRSARTSTVITGLSTDSRNPGCPTITLVAMQWVAGKLRVPVFVLQPEHFQPGVQKIDCGDVSGFLFEGLALKPKASSFTLLFGTLDLKQAGLKAGDKVSGQVEAGVYQMLQ